jgi:hypothetical protein
LELRERQVRGELAAAEPDRLASSPGVAASGLQGDGVAGDLLRVQRAHPRPDQHPVTTQPLAELGEAARPGKSRPDLAAQDLPVRPGRRRQAPLGALGDVPGVPALLGPAGLPVTGPVGR